MGWTIEAKAVHEYWQNYYGDIFPTNYLHSVIGILFDSGGAYATVFQR